MMTDSFKITDKGQVFLPREVRENLRSDIVTFEILNNVVTLKPVFSVAGALKSFVSSPLCFAEERELAWKEVLNDHEK